MRYISYTVLIFFLCCHISAQEYQLSDIESIAYSFFNQGPQYAPGVDSNYIPTIKYVESIEPISRGSIDYMYIVNAQDSAGWVIVSNERAYSTIIAHGGTGSFIYDEELLPPALVWILNNHMNAIDSIRSGSPRVPANTESGSADYDGAYFSPTFLRDIYWMQSLNNHGSSADCDKIYNKFCPAVMRDTCTDWFEEGHPRKKTCNRKLAGCGAIAMAQLMKYWQWPDYAEIENVICHYDWKNMPNYILDTTDMYQVDEVARFIKDCRTAAKSIGCCLWTAATMSNIQDAMTEVFGYHSNLVRPKRDKINITSVIINEINSRRPVIAQAMGDSLLLEWHTFIIDGYKIGKNNYDSTNDTLYHVNFGWGEDESMKKECYYDLQFGGYYQNQIYLTELYPNCSFRANNVLLNNTFTIAANDNRTYYSTNNVTLCSSNNSIIVDNGGHLLIKAGNEVRLQSGFHAKLGSDVHILINDTLCNAPEGSSAPRHVASQSSSTPTEFMDVASEYVTDNRMENVGCKMIQATSIYTISGQLLRTIVGGLCDATHLPIGMYVFQHRMIDGSIICEKIVNNW